MSHQRRSLLCGPTFGWSLCRSDPGGLQTPGGLELGTHGQLGKFDVLMEKHAKKQVVFMKKHVDTKNQKQLVFLTFLKTANKK